MGRTSGSLIPVALACVLLPAALPAPASADWTAPQAIPLSGGGHFDLFPVSGTPSVPPVFATSSCGSNVEIGCDTDLYTRTSAGGAFAQQQTPIDSGLGYVPPAKQFAASPSGQLAVTYGRHPGEPTVHSEAVMLARTDTDGSWQAPVELYRYEAVGGRSIFATAWRPNGVTSTVFTRTQYNDAVGFTTPQLVVRDLPGTASQTLYDAPETQIVSVDTKANSAGRQVVAYTRRIQHNPGGTDHTDDRLTVYAAVREPGASAFSAPQVVYDADHVNNLSGDVEASISEQGDIAIAASNPFVVAHRANGDPTWNLLPGDGSYFFPGSLHFRDRRPAVVTSFDTDFYGSWAVRYLHHDGTGWDSQTIAAGEPKNGLPNGHSVQVAQNRSGAVTVGWLESAVDEAGNGGAVAHVTHRPADAAGFEQETTTPYLANNATWFGVAVSDAGISTLIYYACSDENVCAAYARDNFSASVTITSKPAERTRDRTSTFAFASGAGESFECKLDDASFAACTSPVTVGPLADGSHTFSVRAVSGGSPGGAAAYTFTVDTVAPTARIVQAPAGPSKTPVFTFAADEPDAIFECAIDTGEFRACTSPYPAGGLPDGAHTFVVKAIDALGNQQQQPTTAAFTVGEAGAVCELPRGRFYRGVQVAQAGCQPVKPDPPAECPAGSFSTREIGNLIVAQALTKTACFKKAKGGWVSKGPVRVNGIVMKFKTAKGKLSIEEADYHLYTTKDLIVTLDRVTFPVPTGINWTFTKGQFGGKSPAVPVKGAFQVKKTSPPKVFDFKLAGGVDIAFSSENDGQTKLTFALTLPEAFTLYKGSEKKGTQREPVEADVTANFDMTVSNAKPPSYGGGFQISRANLFGWIELQDVMVYYNLTEDFWLAQASVELPVKSATKLTVPPAGPIFTLGIGLQKGKLKSLSVAASNLNRPLAYGFFVQQLGIAADNIATTAPNGDWNFSITGSGAVSFGPKIDLLPIWEGYLALLAGQVKLAAESAGPALTVSGSGQLLGQTMAAGEVSIQTGTGAITFKGDLSLGVFGYGIFYTVPPSVIDWTSGQKFTLRGYGLVRLPGLNPISGGSVYLNEKGIAACAPLGYGIYYEWASQTMLKFGSGCDLGKLETILRSGRTGSAAGPPAFDLPKGLGLASVAVVGKGAPPKVTLTGPGGRSVSTPAGTEGAQRAGFTLIQDPRDNTTYIAIEKPEAGRWTVAPMPGSVPVTDVLTAQGLPDPEVSAKVSPGARKGTRVLRYAVRAIPGQRVSVYEEGVFGKALISRLRHARGRLAFRPAGGPGGKRRLTAAVEQDGALREIIALGRYKADPPRSLPAPKGLRVKRAKAQAIVSWKKVPRASSYLAVMRASDGRVTATKTRKRSAALRLHPTLSATVQVFALDVADEEGKGAKAKTGAYRKPKRG